MLLAVPNRFEEDVNSIKYNFKHNDYAALSEESQNVLILLREY
jgi:hypothetical protein